MNLPFHMSGRGQDLYQDRLDADRACKHPNPVSIARELQTANHEIYMARVFWCSSCTARWSVKE